MSELLDLVKQAILRPLAALAEEHLAPRKVRDHGLFNPDFVAFDIPDEFVVGYGLDYEDMYRNLPYLAALEAEDIARHKAAPAENQAVKE